MISQILVSPRGILYLGIVSNWTKIFAVIASEGKQSQPLELLHFTSFHMANATLR